MGIALLLGKVFLLLKTFVILSSNNWCFLFFHMTMFDKYLVVLFLYFCHLHSQLHLQHDCPGSWILRWLVVSTWCWCLFFIIIVDFFCTGCWLSIEHNFWILFIAYMYTLCGCFNCLLDKWRLASWQWPDECFCILSLSHALSL